MSMGFMSVPQKVLRNRPWLTTPTELIEAFADALRLLIPVAERVRMPWREPHAYDDWEAICTALFGAIVVGSIENATECRGISGLAQYGYRLEHYTDLSYLTPTGSESRLAFIDLKTTDAAFDTARFSELDEAGRIRGTVERRLRDTEFDFVGNRAGVLTVYDRLAVVL